MEWNGINRSRRFGRKKYFAIFFNFDFIYCRKNVIYIFNFNLIAVEYTELRCGGGGGEKGKTQFIKVFYKNYFFFSGFFQVLIVKKKKYIFISFNRINFLI